MLLNEALDAIDITLEEGIRFFKNSNKMKRLAGVLFEKAKMIPDEAKRFKVVELSQKVSKLSDKFIEIEELYKTNKPEAKKKYKDLENKYVEIVGLAKKEQMKVVLKSIGQYGTMMAMMIIPTLIIGKLANLYGSINPITHNKELNPFARTGVYIGAGIGIRALNPYAKPDTSDVVGSASTALHNKDV